MNKTAVALKMIYNYMIFLLILLSGTPVWAQTTGGGDDRNENTISNVLNEFLGVPFRVDGALDHKGRWVTFNQPEEELTSPGFNCSGFTVAGTAKILQRQIKLDEASLDRLGDSGPGAKLGQDWDFGLDLILNLSQNLPHRFFPPIDSPITTLPIEKLADGLSVGLGVDLSSPELEKHLAELTPGRFAFFVFSKPDKRFPSGVSYYHVGLIVPESDGAIWLYHSTIGAKTHRFNLAKKADLARLRRYFPPLRKGERRILMIEVDPSGL